MEKVFIEDFPLPLSPGLFFLAVREDKSHTHAEQMKYESPKVLSCPWAPFTDFTRRDDPFPYSILRPMTDVRIKIWLTC